MIIRDFCAQVYGEGKAAKVETETDGEYNDEGGTNYSVSHITAYDAKGDELEFDLKLLFWTHSHFLDDQGKFGNIPGETSEDGDDPQDAALEALKDYSPWRDEDKALAEKHGWIEWGNLPVDEHNGGNTTYDLTTQPAISFPVIYAATAD